MVDTLAAIGYGLWMVTRFVLMAVAVTVRAIVAPALRWRSVLAVDGKSNATDEGANARAPATAPAQQQAVPSAPPASAPARVPADVEQRWQDTVARDEHRGADRLMTVDIQGVATLRTRVFFDEQVIKSRLTIECSRLRHTVGFQSKILPDITFDRREPLDNVHLHLANQVIKRVLTPAGFVYEEARKAKAGKKGKSPERGASAAPVQTPPARAPQVAAPSVPAQAATAREVERTKSSPSATSASQGVVSSAKTGHTYVGKLVAAGEVEKKGADGIYTTFEATLLLDGGGELPMCGVELRRALEQAGAKVGQQVTITPMGKVPFSLPKGGEGHKNLYKVENLSVKG